ncbi:MAG TPA: SDR family NAD(P)-dependent oxidoreductase [Gaiellaceae bacterium]|nr:SDR family NAD(P)-dependent oxidoreductase [Gaiellaceae bacterium]
MPEGVAFITGGGRGIGANIARSLAADGWEVVVGARSRDQVEAVAAEIGGRAIELDVSDQSAVDRAFDEVGQIDLLVANAGVGAAEFWRTFEVNVLGVHRCCEAALRHGVSRIVITGSGASYLPGATDTSYTASKAAVCRYAETLNNKLEIPVFLFSPGLVRTAMTEGAFEDDAPWTPPELAPELVRKLATGRYDALAGRYIHAEHDDVDDLLLRIEEIREQDLNAIRLRR